MRSRITGPLLSLATLALLFALGEIALRALHPGARFGTDPVLARSYHPHQTLHYVSSVGEFDVHGHYNSLGMRDREHPAQKPPGRFRVLLLGDSFFEGKQVEDDEIFARQLEREMSRDGAVEVINTGRSGFGTAAEYLVFKHFGASREPDLVIQQFFVNDPADDLEQAGSIEWDERGVPVRRIAGGPHSVLVRYLVDAWNRLPFTSRRHTVTRNQVGDLERDPFAVVRRFFSNGETHWRRSLRSLAASARLAGDVGAHYLLMVVPLGVQVDGRLSAALAETWSLRVEEITLAPQRRLARFGAERGIEVLDLIPVLRDHPGDELYFPADGHWTPRGHAVAARAVARRLRELRWWPPGASPAAADGN